MENTPLRRWKIPTAFNNTFQVKRTQILMFLKRGYVVDDFELQLLWDGPEYTDYINTKEFIESNNQPLDDPLLLETKEAFFEAVDNIEYDDIIRLTDKFERYIEANRNGRTVRATLAKNYYLKKNQVDAVKVIFLEYKEKGIIRHEDIDFVLADTATSSIPGMNIKKLIMFSPQPLANNSMELLGGIRSVKIEVVTETNMRFDPTAHKLQFHFEVMTRKEKKKFMELGYLPEQLPRVPRNDPVVKFLDIAAGEVVKTIRVNHLNQISETSFYARIRQ